ncbi:MAG TPA: metal-dependent hydrolase [Myxococcales bacterium]|nr:metal-dependent hydrolase [Myxococcales bacterium]
MFVLGHLGIGSFLAARRVRAEQLAWLLFGTLLPDLLDKPLYYALVVATGRRGAELGLISGTRTFGHTLLLVVALWLLLPRRIGTPLFLGMATHLFLDELGDIARSLFPALGTHPPPHTINAILFPLLGPHFPVSPYRSALEHAQSLENAWVIAGEAVGAALLVWQWRAGVFDGLRRRLPADKGARGSTPVSR